jgi:hypothetical protein
MRGFWLALLTIAAVNSARADWLADAWSDDASHRRGTPAISFNATGVVTVVLPEAVLAQAKATGLSVESAVGAFLGRYAPGMCSSLLDMSVPHKDLKVDLLVERPVAADNLDAATQEDAAAALNHSLKSPATKSVPHINNVFIVDRKPLNLSIDYAPDHKVHCVERPDVNF